MKIDTAFEIGDIAYATEVTHENTPVVCPDCLGSHSWHAVLPSGEELDFTCPACMFGYESRGVIDSYETRGWVHTLTIGSVRVETDAKPDERVAYMCEETGVGSGRIWYEHRLFVTRELAEASLPSFIEARRIQQEESCAKAYKYRKTKNVGSMVAHYRAQIRSANKSISQAERGLAREATHAEPGDG